MAGMKSATAVTILLVLQLALSTAGQTYQYSRGWTNGRKRSHEVDKELQQYPLTFSSTRPKDFDDDWLEIISQDASFRKNNATSSEIGTRRPETKFVTKIQRMEHLGSSCF